MEIVSLFNGEERRSLGVSTLEEIREASIELAMGDGWGQSVRGTEEELRSVGAYQNEYDGWVLPIDSGHLCVEIVDE